MSEFPLTSMANATSVTSDSSTNILRNMIASDAPHHRTSNAPDMASDAVLKPSAPVAPGARAVRGLEFNDHVDKPLTVEELVEHMGGMGFQATAVSEAVRIVNDMVSHHVYHQPRATSELIKCFDVREVGGMSKLPLGPPSSWAIPQTLSPQAYERRFAISLNTNTCLLSLPPPAASKKT